jgi:hypothetical protein
MQARDDALCTLEGFVYACARVRHYATASSRSCSGNTNATVLNHQHIGWINDAKLMHGDVVNVWVRLFRISNVIAG